MNTRTLNWALVALLSITGAACGGDESDDDEQQFGMRRHVADDIKAGRRKPLCQEGEGLANNWKDEDEEEKMALVRAALSRQEYAKSRTIIGSNTAFNDQTLGVEHFASDESQDQGNGS